jgi:hypothetical protein
MVRRMLRPRSYVFATALVLIAALAACSRKPPEAQAAHAAQALLAAVWSQDEAGFEARLDRPAVRDDLRRQLSEVAQANALSVEGGASDAALDRMITPAAFQLTDAGGAPLAAAPSEVQTQLLITPLDKDHVCLHATIQHTGCMLTFAHRDKAWRLVAMAPAGFTIAVPPEPPKDEK